MKFSAMLHMSNDSHKFFSVPDLIAAGAALGEDGRFRDEEGEVWIPLYEAKMVHQYDHRFATYEGGAAPDKARDVVPIEHADPTFLTLPRYWVPEREANKAMGGLNGKLPKWFIGWRDIARNTDLRTFICTVFPRAVAGDTLLIMQTEKEYGRTITALIANLNAFAFDYIVRQKSGGTHLKFYTVKQLPVLPPETFTPALLDRIVPRVLELVYTAHDLAPFARDCGYDGPPFVWNEERRAQLRADLDGLYAHLYGLSRDDFAYILDAFPIVRRNDEKAHGEFRTKRLCLEAYDYFAPEALEALTLEMGRLERQLRDFIVETLGRESAALPVDMHEKLVSLQQASLKERATPAHAASASSLLEAAYLIDLQKIMIAPDAWPRFEARFGSKTKLRDAFSDLNGFRNDLFHSHSLDDAARRKGEAALQWFKNALVDR